MSTISSDLSYGLQLDRKTADALSQFARRRRVLLVVRAIAAGIVFLFATMLLVAICDYSWLLSDGVRWLLSICGYGITIAAMWWFGLRHFGIDDPRLVARQIESADPRLREDLLSAVELADPNSANGSESFRNWLQHRVARHAGMLDIGRLLPVGLVQRWLLSGILIMLACLVLLMIPRMQFGRRIARAMLPGFAIQRASLTEVTILKPSPPSGYVAEGDAIGVTARVSGAAVEDVMMQWRTEDGIEGESVMSPRVSASTSFSDGTLAHGDIYSANLSVGTTPVEYRIIAGDAITLWNELTPLPRPRVESFKKRYEFPAYAKLADRVEETEHGDLKALVGTLAEVTVRFDEPVSDATLRFGNRGVTFNLEPVAGSDRDYVVTIPIRTPANYQIDATSDRSGLNNPFSPQYSVTPVIDTPPVVQWTPDLPKTLLVSPLDVVALSTTAIDDLPMDRVVQEFQINGEAVVQREVAVPQSSREMNLQWDWDLLRRIDGEEQSIKLSGGDIIRTRVVGIDRKSQRGESGFIELLIAEEGFDKDRHDRLEDLRGVTSELADWALRAKQLMDEVKPVVEGDQVEAFDEAKETAAQLHGERETLSRRLQQAVEASKTLAEASTLELSGRTLLDFDQKMSDWFASVQHVISDDHQAWSKNREKALRDLGNHSRRLAQEASRIEQYARAIFGEELTVGIVADAMSLQQSLRPMLDKESKLPANRFPRYLTVAIGRLGAINDLIEKHQAALPESTSRHLQNWTRWSDQWSDQLQVSIEDPPNEEAHRNLVSRFDAELRNQFNHAMVDGRLASTVVNMLREIRIQVGATSDRLREMAKQGVAAEKSNEQAKKEDNSDNVARVSRDAQYAQSRFDRGREQVLARLAGEESLHRSRPNVDLQFAADMKLMNRAVKNVTQQGYAAYREEPAAIVYQNLSLAFQIIEAKHEADMWLGELRALMLAERRLDETAVEKIKHPAWIERFSTGLEWPVRTLQNAKVDWQAIDQTRRNEEFNQARNRITTRRWSGEEMLTAEIPLDNLQRELSNALDELDPRIVEAREMIRKYVLTLPEQAREAAEKAKEAQKRTESRPDSQQETAETLDQQQQEAEQATQETLESLVDLANTAEVTNAEDRELARDADAAAAQIQAVLERAEDSMDEATKTADPKDRKEALNETAKALEDLSNALEQTAEHFERAENGEDLAETREQLRQAEEALRMQDELQERYDRAEAMADAAQSSPEELMERLERELQQNEPMQQELSEIAERAAEAAQRTLEKAARDEASLNQSLERSDPIFQERKRRAARELANLARRAATVDESLLNATERAIGWANTPEARPKLNEARQELRKAVQKSNEMGGENALLSKMQATAAEMNQAIQDAKEAIQEVNETADNATDENIHKDDASRKKTKDQVERFARDARAQQIRAADNEKRQWTGAESDAGRRVSQAQRQKRDAENQKRQVESRMKKDKKNADSFKPQLAEFERRIEDASRAEQAAKETKDFADQKEKEAGKRSSELKKQKVEGLEKPNPAAELASNMTEAADNELEQIQNDLRELAEKTEFADQLRAPEQQARQFKNQQQWIERDVNNAAEQLRRAARHEQRLGQEELAEQLDAAADAVTENAAVAAAEAEDSLEKATDDADQTPEANRQVAEATEQISAAAEDLARLLEATSPDRNAEALASEANPDEATPSQERAEQLAKTLDELDRAMAQSQQAPQEGDASQQGQPQEGQAQSGEQPPGQQSPPSAADASPTLSGAMDAQAQQAARQRNEQMNPSEGKSQDGPPSDQTASDATNPANQPGGGNMPGGGFVETMGVERVGNEWGQLRERRTDDAAESRSAKISPQYRREIEAYFRAIARRAAEREE